MEDEKMVTSIILWIVFGGIAGWIASLITNTNRNLLGDIVLGILGSVIGGWLFSLIGGQQVTGFNLPSLLVAVLGSIVLIWVAHSLEGSAKRA